MALKGNYTKDGISCSQAYVWIDGIQTNKGGHSYHWSLHSQPPARDGDGVVTNRFTQIEHGTSACSRVEGEDPFDTCYAALKAATRFASFVDA